MDCIVAISDSVGGRSSQPTPAILTAPCAANIARLIPGLTFSTALAKPSKSVQATPPSGNEPLKVFKYDSSSALRQRLAGKGPTPQFEVTSVVTPCITLLSPTGLSKILRSVWVWRSIKPGATTRPDTSTTCPSASLSRPISRIIPCSTQTSAE